MPNGGTRYDPQDFYPHSQVKCVLYLLEYSPSDLGESIYKIGITSYGLLDKRVQRLQHSINRASTKEYKIRIKDSIICKNKYSAHEKELMFKNYDNVSTWIKPVDGMKIEGNWELFNSNILEKWFHYKEKKVFDPTGLRPRNIIRYCKKIIKGKWEDAEDILIGSPYAEEYAIIRNERWLEFEDIIEERCRRMRKENVKMETFLERYCKKYDYKLGKGSDSWAASYCLSPGSFIKKMGIKIWPEFEKKTISKLRRTTPMGDVTRLEISVIKYNSEHHKSKLENRDKKILIWHSVIERALDYLESSSRKDWGEIVPMVRYFPELWSRYIFLVKNVPFEELESKILRELKFNSGRFAISVPKTSGKDLHKWTTRKLRYHSYLELATNYSVGKNARWAEVEKHILRCPNNSLKYSIEVIKDRWLDFEEKHENFILKSALYHAMASKKRSLKFEKWILEKIRGFTHLGTVQYQIKGQSNDEVFKNGRKVECEDRNQRRDIISKLKSYISILEINSWPSMENLLNSTISLIRNGIMEDPWLEPVWIYMDAVSDWPGLEEALLGSENFNDIPSDLWGIVIKLFTMRRERNHIFEEFLLNNGTPNQLARYAKICVAGRWEEAEKGILKSDRASMSYAAYCIKGRWDEGEIIIRRERKYLAEMYAYLIIQGDWPEAGIVLSEVTDKRKRNADIIYHSESLF